MMAPIPPEQLKADGLRLFQAKRYDAALQQFQTAVAAFAAQGNAHGQAEMLNNIGVLYRLKKNPKAAVAALQEADQLFSQLGAANQQAQTLANLADLYATTGAKDAAAQAYSQAAAIFAQLDDGAKQSQVLRAYSLLRLRQRNWLEAFVSMEKSLAVRPSLGLFGWLFRSLLRIALALFKLERL